MKITKQLLKEIIEQETTGVLQSGKFPNQTGPENFPAVWKRLGEIQRYVQALWEELGDPNTGRDVTQNKILKLQKRIRYLERLVRKHEKQPHVTDTTSSSKT